MQVIYNSILPTACIESLVVNPDIVLSLEEDTQDDDIIDWIKAHAMDPVIKPFIKYVREGINLKQQMLDLHHYCDSLVSFGW